MHHMKPGAVSMGKVFVLHKWAGMCFISHGKTMEEDIIKKHEDECRVMSPISVHKTNMFQSKNKLIPLTLIIHTYLA